MLNSGNLGAHMAVALNLEPSGGVPSAKKMRIRVLVADSNALIRRGLREELSRFDDIELVGEAADGHQALEMVRLQHPDVVILDMSLAGMGGVELTRVLRDPRRSTRPCPEVLVFTEIGDRFYALALLMAGARGYLFKSEPVERVVAGLRDLMRGGVVLSPSVSTMLVEWVSNYSVVLSKREREILKLMARGLTNEGIAASLGISPATVQRHLHNSYHKLPFVRSRAEAIAWAWINGIVQPE